MDGDGSFENEVIGLDNPVRYVPGSTFWKVAVIHFSSWDCNWSFGPPYDAIYPNPEGEMSLDIPNEETMECSVEINSFVEERGRVYNDDIQIYGTDMTLHYSSGRVPGFKPAEITIPVSGETVPASLKRIEVITEMLGKSYEQILPPSPNQIAEIVWDGLDYLGNKIAGPINIKYRIGFVYDGVYQKTYRFSYNGSGQITGSRSREEIGLWKRYSGKINVPPHSKVDITGGGIIGDIIIAKGWTLSSHHYLNPRDPSTLHKGDGAKVKNSVVVMSTFAGNGEEGFSIDGSLASSTSIGDIYDFKLDKEGNIYYIEYNRVRKIDTNGIITTVAGSGNTTDTWSMFEGGPATDASIEPSSVTVDENGILYIADNQGGTLSHSYIRKVDNDGIITTIGIGPTIDTVFDKIDVDSFGNIYISSTFDHRIYKLDPDGVLSCVAGSGPYGWYYGGGYSGDGGPATEARLNQPGGIALDNYGNLYIADRDNSRIRKVDTSGIITTVAGNGATRCEGNGIFSATQIGLGSPSNITVDKDGNIFIVDCGRIRKIDTSGLIRTIAGSGNLGFSFDGIPTTKASFNQLRDIAVDPFGDIYAIDGHNYRIRKLVPNNNFQDYIYAGEIPFPEENGLCHIMSKSGRHKKTIDLETKKLLREFNYDPNNNLISINDQFGNQVTFERNADGIPKAIVSSEGLRTELVIDEYNHLIKIVCPDGSDYNFEYSLPGLMEAKTDPAGNRFENDYNFSGRLTDIYDEEGGHWNYNRSNDSYGVIKTDVLSEEGNLTTYLDRVFSSGFYTSTIISPSGDETNFSKSSDGLTVSKSLPCGMEQRFEYDVDLDDGDHTVTFYATDANRDLTTLTVEFSIDTDADDDDDNGDNDNDRDNTIDNYQDNYEEELYLDHNLLTTIPKELGNLVNLEELSLLSNRLTDIPKELGNLVNLDELYLDPIN